MRLVLLNHLLNIPGGIPPHKRLLTLLGLALLAFLPALDAGFVWDDHFLVEQVDAYHQFDLGAILLTPVNGFEYLPVRDLTLALDALIWGQQPFGYHLSNLLYYLLGLLLALHVLQRLAQRLGARQPESLAFWSVALFAVHPLHTEVVAFITARNNILALLFLLWALNAFLDLLQGHRRAVGVCLLAFLLAFLSKASAVFMPFALAAVYMLSRPLEEPVHKRVQGTLVLLLLVAVAGVALHVGVARELGTIQPNLGRFGVLAPTEAIWRAALIPMFYLRYFLIPWPLNIAYDETELLRWAESTVALPLYALYLLALLIAWSVRRRSRWHLLALLWFFLSLLPVSNLLPTVPIVADRYAYPGSLGLAMLAAPLLVHWRAVGWLLLIICAILSFDRSLDWDSNRTLWAASWQVTPETSADEYFWELYQSGRLDEAVRLATAEQPRGYRYFLYRGIQSRQAGDLSRAINYLRRANQLAGTVGEAVKGKIQRELAQTYERAGRPLQALEAWLELLAEDAFWSRRFFGAEAEQAVTRIRERLWPRRQELQQTARNNPDSVRAQGEFGMFLLRTGEYASATEYLRHALELRPGNDTIRYNLALAARKAGRDDLAREQFGRIPRSSSLYGESRNLLAMMRVEAGDLERAKQRLNEALDQEPDLFSARYNLARLHYRRGDRSAARRILTEDINEADAQRVNRIERTLGQMGLDR